MNAQKWVITATIAATLAVAGCSKNSSVDTAPLEKSFSSAEPAVKNSADKAVTAIRSSDFSGAMTELKTLSSKAKLTPDQQQAVKDVLAQVEKAVADTATKVKDDASKTLDNATKSLPK